MIKGIHQFYFVVKLLCFHLPGEAYLLAGESMNNTSRSLRLKLRDGVTLKEDLPFEKFLKYGPQNLTDSELLAIIIRCGTKDHDPMEIGQEILRRCRNYESGIGGLYQLSVDELKTIDGLGQVKAVQIKCIAELSLRISRSKKNDVITFTSSEDIALYYMEQLRHKDQEHVILIALDARMRLICDKTLYIGTVSSCTVSARDIFRQALMTGAAQIALIHNHPSGSALPSDADIQMTRRIWELGRVLEIPVYDHIIIGDRQYSSLNEIILKNDQYN